MNCRTFSQNPRTPPLFLTPYDRERNLFAIKQWQATKDKTQLKKKKKNLQQHDDLLPTIAVRSQ